MSTTSVPSVSRSVTIAPATFGGVLRAVGRAGSAAIDALLTWQERAAERAHLSALEDRILRDIGLSRADADHEASKPFWRP
jgi:uncharacterized protein YjiS (DUF1127 family)